ncbi:MAG: alkaline phosphatase family protein, partial [Candidatus Sulfotelmatobacter sp.]
MTSSPAGINCATGSTATCSANFPPNTQVTLSETPAASNAFSGWSGACTGTASCSVTLSAASAVTATFVVGGTLQSLNHLIIFAQENRSLDHYFGYMEQYWAQHGYGTGETFDGLPQFSSTPGATPSLPGCDPSNPNGTDVCTPDPSNPVPSFHLQSICTEELSPFWNEARTDWNDNFSYPTQITPLLNGFVVAGANDARQYPLSSNGGNPVNDVNGYRTMGYFQDSDLPYYYYMASNFATSDRWFAPIMSRTQLNRMYILAATSAGHAYPLSSSNSTGTLPNVTIFQALQKAGITWKIYVKPPKGTTCEANPTAECLYNYSYINMFQYGQTIVQTLPQNLVPITTYMSDVKNGTLPQVALIEPASDDGLDEHPTDDDTNGGVNIQAGA